MIDTDDIVERYSKVISSEGFATMEKCGTGRWVEYSAYKSLQQRIAKLEFEIDFRGKILTEYASLQAENEKLRARIMRRNDDTHYESK